MEMTTAEGMKTALFRRRSREGRPGETQVDVDGMTMRILRSSPQPTVAVSGRVTIDSSPTLRSALLDLIREHAAPVLVMDLSGVSHMDASGLATLLEVLKAAHKCSVKLRLAGISGQPRRIAELTDLAPAFRAAGSEVEFS